MVIWSVIVTDHLANVLFLNTLFILDIKQWEQIETWLLQSDVQEYLLLDVQAVERGKCVSGE